MQGHPGSDHSHLVILALQDHLRVTQGGRGPVRLRDWWPEVHPDLGLILWGLAGA